MASNDTAGTLFDRDACWVWVREGGRRYNQFASFRREVDVVGEALEAKLNITADARYELYVNGRWLGHGPSRSWPEPWPVDAYDLGPELKPGRNVIAVLVTHFGIGTMQYLLEMPGLLAQMDWRDRAGSHRMISDERWRACEHEGYAWPVPRASVPLGWEEQFDARRSERCPAGWEGADFDDASWPSAKPVRQAGQPPHATFERRTIPMLTRDPVSPAAVVSADVVTTAPYQWSLLLRNELGMRSDDVSIAVGRLLLATHIYSPKTQVVELMDPHQLSPWPTAQWKLNGEPFGPPPPSAKPFADLTWGGAARCRLALRAGWNVLLARPSDIQQASRVVINAWADEPISFHARPTRDDAEADQPPWLVLGPFDGAPDARSSLAHVHRNMRFARPAHAEATAERFERIWESGELSGEDLTGPFARPLRPEHIVPADVFACCASERVLENLSPRIEQVDALLHDDDTWTTIHPEPAGEVRLLLDFGRELIGYHEFEIDAPAGAIIDVHGFEFIQANGRHNLAEGMNNTFRYTCREGVQRYRTFFRRGFRYTWIRFGRFDRPIRVRMCRALSSTYPPTGHGAFACADPMLSHIWEVGANTVQVCSEDTYTDCPTYEQVLWVGDARNEALVDLVVNGDPRLSRHCWLQAARSLERSALVESHVPSAWCNILPAWSFLWMRWAREHYEATGDSDFVREALPWIQRNIDGICAHLNEDHLFEIRAWNMFDWAPMDVPVDGVVTHQNCLAVLGLRDVAVLARHLSDEARAAAWDALADDLARAINRHLWAPHHHAYVDSRHADGRLSEVFSQQTQTAALLAGVAAGERARLCRMAVDHPPAFFVKAGSPFFMSFLLETLGREGRTDRIIQVIRDYWGPQIEAGATTFWEMYHPHMQRMTRSHCHGWSAAPTLFLTRYVLGLQPLDPGYRRIAIRPTGQVAWARGRLPTPQGIVELAWQQNAQGFDMKLELPRGITAVIEVPDGCRFQTSTGRVGDQPEANSVVVRGKQTLHGQLVHPSPHGFGKPVNQSVPQARS